MACIISRNTTLFKIGTLILVLSLLGLAVGYGIPHWSYVDSQIYGLWQFCVSGNCQVNVGAGDPFDSAWYIATQALVSTGVVIVLATTAVALTALCCSFLGQTTGVSASIAGWTALAGILIIIGVVLFAIETVILFPGAAFGFAFMTESAAAGVLIVPVILFAVDACMVSLKDEENKENDETRCG